MPVLYYVDPKILDDADGRDVQEITLSYTFYPIEQDGKPLRLMTNQTRYYKRWPALPRITTIIFYRPARGR